MKFRKKVVLKTKQQKFRFTKGCKKIFVGAVEDNVILREINLVFNEKIILKVQGPRQVFNK